MNKATELKVRISNYLIENLMKDDLKNSLNLFISTELKNMILDKKDTLLKSEAYKTIQVKIKNELLNIVKSSDFKSQISNLIDNNLSTLEKSNKTLDKAIPPAVINSLKVYIYNHRDELIAALKKLLSNKDIEKRILSEINNVMNGMNPMVARFVNINNIFTRLKSSIEDYLNDSKNIVDIINFINNELDIIMKKKVSEICTYFPIEGRKAIINSITNALTENLIKPSFIDMIFSTIDEKISNELWNLNMDDLNSNFAINDLISHFINTTYDKLLISSELKEIVNKISDGIVDNFLSKPLIDLI